MQILEDMNFIDEKTNLIHSVHFKEEELRIAKLRNASLVHCPTSNLKLASGILPLDIAWNLGISVALGTDSVASNNNMDMF
jgi:5-methylthioadenosine/S-adenosylhomocysteine deaminase